MPLRFLKYLANNERLVQKIAESYPVKRAAQMCVSLYYRTQSLIMKENIPPPGSINSTWIISFLKRFKSNLSEGLKDAKQQIKDNEKKLK